MPAEPTAPTSPKRENCEVQDRVAIGTAGVVYRAVQTETNQMVTFKVLSSTSTHPLETARVLAMGWRLRALKHPVIAPPIDAYEDPDGFVIITTWMSGGFGANEFPRKRRLLTKQEARLVAMRLCGALLAGERQRFPHGDLKPSNIILAESGEEGLEVQIQDWGIHACREAQPPETVQFMAPERHHGHPATVQGDLFTAGATLWFLLTGEPPSQGASRDEVLQTWGSFDATSLAQKRPDLDEHFCQWLAWLLRWQPADRPRSASQALEVLNEAVGASAALAAEPGDSPPVTVPSLERAAAVRRGAARLRLPVATGKALASGNKAPPQPRASIGQRFMATVMLLCIIGGIAVAFVAWAENRYGTDWKQKLGAHWRGMFSQPATAIAATPSPAHPPSAPVAITPKTPLAAKSTKSVVASSSRAARPLVSRPFMTERFDGTGGAGWKGPWQTEGVVFGNKQAQFGKGAASAATRPLGTLKNLPNDYLVMSFLVTHPGKDGAPLRLDVLSPDGSKFVAPARIAFEDGKLCVTIEGAKEKLEAPLEKPFRLLLRWDWKNRKPDGSRQISISATVNPDPDPQKAASVPSSRRVLTDQSLPSQMLLMLRSGSAAQPVTIEDVRVGRYYRDAFP